MKKILGFSGSNSSTSINQALVAATLPLAKDAETTLLDLRDFPAPIYSIDLEKGSGFPPKIQELAELFKEYDAFVISTPEHNGQPPAFLKNHLDWFSRMEGKVFENKPVLLLSSSPGRGGAAKASELVGKLIGYLGGRVIQKYPVNLFSEKVSVGEAPSIIDETTKTDLINGLDQLLTETLSTIRSE